MLKTSLCPLLLVVGAIICQVLAECGVEPGCSEDAILLQTQHKSKQEPPTSCALPEGAKWALVQTPQQRPYYMAVYSTNDIVSAGMSQSGTWESIRPEAYGPPGHAYDIGANMGSYTFALAKAGWNVTAFEPMKSNARLVKASLCANPDVQDRIDLHRTGLGDSPAHCRLVSPPDNFGDGIVECGGERRFPEFEVRDEFDVKLLDQEMESSKFAQQKVAFVKIDVEGFECRVFRGGKKLLAQHPRLIQTEMWGTMQDCDPRAYMKIFTDAEYKVAGEVQCKSDSSDKVPVPGAITDKWMCSKTGEDGKGHLSAALVSAIEFHKNFGDQFHSNARTASHATVFMEPVS